MHKPSFAIALGVWLAGISAYVAAVAARTSLGVASVIAADRFEVAGTTLALFGVVQLGTYAASQFPAGLLLDRLGPRTMLLIGVSVMAVGQLLMAIAPALGWALAARILTGMGDAAVFISVVRLVTAWFPDSKVPLFTQLTGVIGQLGQVISAVPFFLLLRGSGWGTAFAALAVLLGVSALLVVLFAKDAPTRPDPAETGPRLPFGFVLHDVTTSPGAWAGFFTHLLGLGVPNAFLFLWAVPFYELGHGLSPAEISTLLTAGVLAGMVLGPLFGALTARFSDHLGIVVTAGTLVAIAIWVITLAQPGPLTMPQLLPLAVAVGLGGAISGVGFELARRGVLPTSIGTASGLVNMGGFGVGLVAVWLVGVVLDLRTGRGDPDLADYRAGLASALVVFVIGLVGLAISLRRAALHRSLDPVGPVGSGQSGDPVDTGELALEQATEEVRLADAEARGRTGAGPAW